MPRSITRFGNLGQVFREGESELLNEVARVTILYEDLRLELGELRVINERRDAKGPMDGDDFRVAYFMRRALVTLIEFRRVLTTLRRTEEFKRQIIFHPEVETDELLPAEQYFQHNGARLKELRNEFGGHIQPAGVKFATGHVSDVTGKITMNRHCDGWTLGLDCDFASHLVSAVITSKLQGIDYLQELRDAFKVIADGFNQVQAATAALVYLFLWSRFGK